MFSKSTLAKMHFGRNGILATIFVLSLFALPGAALSSFAATGNSTSSTPAVKLSPVRFIVGGTVNVIGTGFLPNAPIALTLGGNPLPKSSTMSNSTGDFKTSFVVPTLPAGYYTVKASDGTQSAKKLFRVMPFITIVRTTIKPGYMPKIDGNGFAANSVVTITANGNTLGTATSTSQGTFVFPATPVSPGKYTVTATDASGNTRSIGVTVR